MKSSLRSGSAQSKQLSVTFMEDMESVTDMALNTEQQLVLGSIRKMMASESSGLLGKPQQRALDAVRGVLMGNIPYPDHDITASTPAFMMSPPSKDAQIDDQNKSLIIYTLASHMSHESITLGIDPSSLFYSIADIMNRTSSLLYDLEREKDNKSMMFHLPETPRPCTSLKKVHFLEVGYLNNVAVSSLAFN